VYFAHKQRESSKKKQTFVSMSGTAGTDCQINGDTINCPAGADFVFDGTPKYLEATITCPFDSVAQSQWKETSQEGLCTCNGRLLDENRDEEEGGPITCECYACPDGSAIGFAYSCDRTLFGSCTSFDCDFGCNNGYTPPLAGGTFAPTGAPVGEGSAAAAAAMPLFWIVALAVFPFRHWVW
jgi:hypothetical protein